MLLRKVVEGRCVVRGGFDKVGGTGHHGYERGFREVSVGIEAGGGFAQSDAAVRADGYVPAGIEGVVRTAAIFHVGEGARFIRGDRKPKGAHYHLGELLSQRRGVWGEAPVPIPADDAQGS